MNDRLLWIAYIFVVFVAPYIGYEIGYEVGKLKAQTEMQQIHIQSLIAEKAKNFCQ